MRKFALEQFYRVIIAAIVGHYYISNISGGKLHYRGKKFTEQLRSVPVENYYGYRLVQVG